MSPKSMLLNLTVLALVFSLAACGGALPQTSTSTPPLPSNTPTASQPLPASTPRLVPSQTHPIPTTEAGGGPETIQPSNAGQVIELARLGKGTILSHPLYSPNGLWIAIPTSVGVYLYNAETLEEQYKIPVATPFIAFSPDGSSLAASQQGAVSLWNTSTGIRMGELASVPEDWHWELAFSPDASLLAAVTWNGQVSVWSLESGERLFTFPGHRLEFSPDGELAVVAIYGENRVHLYETGSGAEVNKWDLRHAGFAPGGQLWLEDSESVRLVDVDRDQVTAPFNGVQPSFSADGKIMALFANRRISLYDHQVGRRTVMLEGSYVQIDELLFSPDAHTLAGAVYTLHCPTCTEIDGLDRSLVLWRAEDGSIIKQLDLSAWMAYSADGSELAIAQVENVQVLETAGGSIVNRIDGFTNPVEGMALSPDRKTLAAAHAMEEYSLRLWDLETGHLAHEIQSQQAGPLSNVEVAYSPDGKYIAVGGELWDLEAGELLTSMLQAIIEKTSCWPSTVAFSPQGGTMTTGCFDGQLDLWSVPGGGLVKSLRGYESWVYAVAYSPDGEYLAAVYSPPDYLVQIWQMPEGKASFTITGGHFKRVAYSPDGKTLATVAVNEEYGQYGQPAGFVQLWNASDGKELARLEVDDVVSIAFSPDSRILASGSLDGALRLWQVEEGKLLMETHGHYGSIERVIITPDGTRLVSGSLDGTISIWGFPTRP